MFLVHQMSVAMFRFMGAIGRTLVIATTFGSTLVLFIVTLSGFVLAYPQVTPWPAWKQFHGHSRLSKQNADRFGEFWVWTGQAWECMVHLAGFSGAQMLTDLTDP